MTWNEQDVKKVLTTQTSKDEIRRELKQLLGMISSVINRHYRGRGMILNVMFQVTLGNLPDYCGKSQPVHLKFYEDGAWLIIFRPGDSEPIEYTVDRLPLPLARKARESVPAIITHLTSEYPYLTGPFEAFLNG